MDPKAVKVPVVASIPIDCLFWPESDGWTGACAELSLTVQANSFEEAKKKMEAELAASIKDLIPGRRTAA